MKSNRNCIQLHSRKLNRNNFLNRSIVHNFLGFNKTFIVEYHKQNRSFHDKLSKDRHVRKGYVHS